MEEQTDVEDALQLQQCFSKLGYNIYATGVLEAKLYADYA